ncbi:MAG: hypothetical protein HYX76_12760 [Acidobacteria bacterium]|nr:hypothetical protein [Acidobacteriota bacterium]
MPIAILGAGELGGALASKLAGRDCVDLLRLIDDAGSVAAGKALDIQQAGPIEAFRTRVIGSADVSDAAGADLIVLADAVGTGDWRGEPGLALLKRLAGFGSVAPIVFAGAGQRELMEVAARELRIAPKRLIGSAPGALAAALAAIIALDTNGSSTDISISLVGTPPERTVVSWSEAGMAGQALGRILSPPQIARLNARLPSLWPPGPYALASAASRVAEAVVRDSRRRFSCFAVLEDIAIRGRVTAVPVTLGADGIRKVVMPSLSAFELVQFGNAVV